MKLIFTWKEMVAITVMGLFVMFAIDILLGPPEDRGKLPADYGMDNTPVTICIDNDIVVPCE